MKIQGFRLMSEIPTKSTKWLWEGRIPLGEVTILEGHPGTNKSSLTDDLAARLTKGKAMPCVASKQNRKGGVLFLIGEDSPSKTVKGRLLAAEADLSKVGVLEHIAIPDDMLTVEKAVIELDAKLIVVDSINDFLHCNVLGNQQVRKALEPLRQLADKRNVAVVAIRHFIKSGNGHSLLRGGGSVGITAMARSQLKLYKHPDDPHLRVLIQDKSNLGPISPSLQFEVVPTGNGAFWLDWQGKSKMTIEDLERKHKESPKLEAAEKFLVERLADGPKEANWLLEKAKNVCSKRTLPVCKE
jgi:RecA-family ATPase